jgi:hypothetical protein
MKLKNLAGILIMLLFLAPNLAFGAPTLVPGSNVCSNSDLQKGVGYIFNFVTCTLVKNIVPLLITLAMVGFIWGVIQMYINPNNEEAKKKGKLYIFWGLLGLFVIISVWGLVEIFSNTFGVHTFIPQLSNQ